VASNDDNKIYPGNIDEYRRLRTKREEMESDAKGADQALILAAVIAEQLAGLSYILDGIRYSARRS
jgi:hypothetical protein